ncbi:retron system putative HNH endonuclease [Polyangium aurulentum]|uniref:retron system putative HNH endonuclease n=1 Tax=Polyangium aurulentum TaxID=2567896 RepID=UPI0010AEE6C6|nr:retron system putative HNH endonuclease [Polyangium aurulentum]UQA54921.1 TIGR02646 family protein [Polyangium aurulentum]
MLRHSKGQAPRVLTGWQATPGADWESLSAADKDKVREALLRDQGRLCAYCQRRIPTKDKRMKVEHWSAQSGGEGKLRWTNLLGVCLGDAAIETGSTTGERHCDTARGDKKLFLHPVEGQGPSPREYLGYTAEGEARPSKEKTDARHVAEDISALNLNAQRLRRARREVYEMLKQRLEEAGWDAAALRAEYKAAGIQPGVPALEHCEMVRYHLQRWARKQNIAL